MSSAVRTRPVSSYPGFKWAVGAWFALLLGLGLFFMPPEIHAMLVERLGIEDIVPAGIATRAALAGAAGVVGLVFGLLIALRIAAQHDASVENAEDEGEEFEDLERNDDVWLDDAASEAEAEGPREKEPRRPFNPREELDEDGAIGFVTPAEGIVDAEWADTEDGIIEAVESEDGPVAHAHTDEHIVPYEEAAPHAVSTALGDLSLDALTARLGAALEAHKASLQQGRGASPNDLDQVVAFPGAELAHTASERLPENHEDPQVALRRALDKLGRTGQSG